VALTVLLLECKEGIRGAYTKERSISDISATGGVKQRLFSHELDLPIPSANQHIIGHIGIIIKSKDALLLEVIGESKRERSMGRFLLLSQQISQQGNK
jgi:hypothetical protein